MADGTATSFRDIETQVKCEIVSEDGYIKAEVFDNSSPEHKVHDLKIEENYHMDFETAIKTECASNLNDSQPYSLSIQFTNVLETDFKSNSDRHRNKASTSTRPEKLKTQANDRRKTKKSTKSAQKSENIQISPSKRKRRKKKDDITFVCGFCTKIFMNSKDFFSHMNSHSNNFNDDVAKNNYDFRVTDNHLNNNKDRTKNKKKKRKTNKHIKNAMLKCNSQFINTKMDNDKQKIKHESKQTIRQREQHESHQCDQCSRTFTYKSNLHRHKMLHKENKQRAICDFCNKGFVRKSYLSRHIKEVHLRIRTNNMSVCKLCNKSVTTAYALRCHMQIHSGRKPFQCNICMKGFSNKWNLKIHSNSHKK